MTNALDRQSFYQTKAGHNGYERQGICLQQGAEALVAGGDLDKPAYGYPTRREAAIFLFESAANAFLSATGCLGHGRAQTRRERALECQTRATKLRKDT